MLSGVDIMDIFLKTLAVVLLGIGAFIVYGARIIASSLKKRQKHNGSGDENVQETKYNELMETSDNKLADYEEEQEIKPNSQIVNIKIFGMIFIIAGAIIALITFR